MYNIIFKALTEVRLQYSFENCSVQTEAKKDEEDPRVWVQEK